MKPRLLILLLVLGFSNYPVAAQSVSAVFHHLTVEDGLTDGNIRCIVQDPYGFIWFGTRSGLNRYDGYSVKTYQKKIKDPNSISDDFINNLLFTDDNKLWIATASGLTIYDMVNDTFTRWFHKENDPQSIPSNDVRKIVQDAKKNLWIAAGGRVVQYSPLTNQFIHYPSLKEPPLPNIFDMVFDNKGRLWLTSGSWGENANNGLFVIKPGSLKVERIPWPSEYKGKPVSHSLFGMAFDPSGYIWCSSFSGMIFKIQTDTYAVQMIDDLMKQGADQNLCSSICCDSRGRIWFGTRFTGVAMYESSCDSFKFFKHYPFVHTSVSSSTIDAVSCDRSGMIWVGTSGKGVDRFHPDRQHFISIYSGADVTSSLPSPWVRCFTENAQNQLLIGTTEGLTQYDLLSNTFLTYQKDPTNPGSISFSSIRALLKDRNGNVWVGTASGLNLMMAGEKTFTRFMRNRKDPYSVLTSFFYSIIEDMQGNIWVAGDGGMELVDLAKNRFYNRRNDSLLSKLPRGSLAWCTYPDSKGNIWIGYQGDGLLKMNYQDKTFHLYKATGDSTGLPHSNVNDIGEDHDGYIWVGTNGGLCRLAPETNVFTTFTVNDGLPSNKISGIMVDHHNRVWMATSRGLVVYDQSLKTFRIFTVYDGLPTNQFNDQKTYRTHDGYFCYATMNGALIFHPDSIRTNQYEPPVNITRLSVFGEIQDICSVLDEKSIIVLSWKENFFTIDFTVLNFDQPEENEYACQLIGFDREMQFLGNRNSVSYTNVPPGDYTLHVIGANNDGVWNRDGASVNLQIIPPWWQTNWFRVLAIIVISLLFYSLYRYRISLIRKREGEKTEINKRIAELRLSALRTQMNPHFIFNSISSIQNLISQEKKDDSMDYIGKFSRLIRLILHQAENNSIVLSEEVDLLELYLEMETLRFEKSFNYSISVDPLLEEREPEIPTMIIQPIVENAIIHGLLNKEKKGNLTIDFLLKGEFVECIVRDNGVGRRAAEEIKKGKLFQHNAIATRITGERLEILNKVFHMPTSIHTIDLIDENGNPAGTQVNIDLPMIEN